MTVMTVMTVIVGLKPYQLPQVGMGCLERSITL